ncbi:hypothetical protein TNCV_1316121 [Trichonephila clavipes]|nr:hypothetical protein TNCV_1316121 [Trichonephila clavipes]
MPRKNSELSDVEKGSVVRYYKIGRSLRDIFHPYRRDKDRRVLSKAILEKPYHTDSPHTTGAPTSIWDSVI